MRFQMMGDWPIQGGAMVVPASTIIDAQVNMIGNALVFDAKFNGVPLPMPPPLNAMALDNEAARVMLRSYPDQRHVLHFGPGVEL